ncbi:MAG: hypothetical protein JXR96_11760 [Deltaproteobacteria bacterium]|nr:hypothetical protein [Deltaproteobacteria bacterium]
MTHRISSLLGLAWLLVACGGGALRSPDAGSDAADGCESNGERRLSIVGESTRVIRRGQQAELQVLFEQDCTGPIAGATVSFEISDDPGGSWLDSDTAVTGPDGVAGVVLTAGSRIGEAHVRAHHPDDPAGVSFLIRILPGTACECDEDCPPGFRCAAGICEAVCEPATCESLGKDCGSWPDGCEAELSCGECGAGQTCNRQGHCEATCTPDCSGRCCGDDGCGSPCPDDCPAGTTCDPQSCVCEPIEPGLSIKGCWLGMTGQDGVWRVAIPSGMIYPFGWYGPGELDRVANSGKNLVYAWVRAGYNGLGTATLYDGGHLSQGWNEQAWTNLEQMLQRALDRDIGVMLAFWDTTGLEGDRSAWPEEPRRWDVNPWNAYTDRGGPYALPGCGKAAFVGFHDFDAFLYLPGGSYPAGQDDITKGQWRQEEVLYRVAELARGYPNAAIYLIWEADDNGSHSWGDCSTDRATMLAWHVHMTELVHALSPDTLVTSGDLPGWDGFGFAASQVKRMNWWADKPYPVVSTGFPMRDGEGDVCLASCSDEVYRLARSYIRDGWLVGIQLGAPYNEYRNDGVSDAMDPYTLALRQRLDSIQTWEDEPGVELNSALLPAP